jgi:glutamate 5-kinase
MSSSSMGTSRDARAELKDARCVVVKVGSALLAQKEPDPFASFAAQIAELRKKGVRVVLVSSGAIALGFPALGLAERPKDLAGLQASAAAGQSKLMWRWGEAFHAHGLEVAQVLLTHADLKDRRRYLNARQAFLRLLDAGVVPVVNENDTVAVDEIKLGDNDTLAAQVCGLCDAQAVVLLTGAAGLFTADPSVDPGAVRIPVVDILDDAVRALAGPAARLGTGGMITKLDAAAAAQRHGAATVIAPGRQPGVLASIFAGDDVGTVIRAPVGEREGARKRWIGTALRARGTVFVDEGAESALKKNASLLFAGVRKVDGTFLAGDCVNIARVADGSVFARGLVRLSSTDAAVVAGRKSAEAQALLPALPDELIHRDDLVLLVG